MATYSVGNPIRVTGAVSGTGSGLASGVLYTAPANGYAIINYVLAGGSGARVLQIGPYSAGSAPAGQTVYGIAYVGPGLEVRTSSSFADGALSFTGVEFGNSF